MIDLALREASIFDRLLERPAGPIEKILSELFELRTAQAVVEV